MTRKRKARCVKCYEEMWDKYGGITNSLGQVVYQMRGRWEHTAITQGPRGGFIAKCKNCGHEWRISHKTALASGFSPHTA